MSSSDMTKDYIEPKERFKWYFSSALAGVCEWNLAKASQAPKD